MRRRSPGDRVHSVVRDIKTGNISSAELSKRIADFDLSEVRKLGRALLGPAKEKHASDMNEYIAVVRAAVRGLE